MGVNVIPPKQRMVGIVVENKRFRMGRMSFCLPQINHRCRNCIEWLLSPRHDTSMGRAGFRILDVMGEGRRGGPLY